MSKRINIEGKRYTKTTTFVVPMCNLCYHTFPDNFINSYILFENNKPNYQIVLVFNSADKSEFFNRFYLERIITNKNYITTQEHDDEIVVYFNIPKENHDNFDLFIKGKYSKFSNNYKKVIESFYGGLYNKDSYYVYEMDVIHPSEWKRLQIAKRFYNDKEAKEKLNFITEVLDIPDLEKEKFRLLQDLETINNIENQYDNKQ